MTILMVDDQKSVLDGLLSGLDFESVDIDRVYAASSAAEAMEVLRRQPVDILMTDIEMPGKNGLELVSMAKELQPDLLLILLTSHAVFAYAQDSVKLGCFDYIVQPAPYELILETLRRAAAHLKKNQLDKVLHHYGSLFVENRSDFLNTVAYQLISENRREMEEAVSVLARAGLYITSDTAAQLILVDDFSFSDQSDGALSRKEFRAKLLGAVRGVIPEQAREYLVAVTEERESLMVLLYPENGAGRQEGALRRLFESMQSTLGAGQVAAYVAPAMPVCELHRAHAMARATQQENVGRTAGLFYARAAAQPAEAPRSVQEYLTSWDSMLRANNRAFLLKNVDEYIDTHIAGSDNKFQKLCELHQQLTQILFRYFFDNQIDIDSLFSERYTYADYLQSYHTIDAFKKSIRYLLHATGQKCAEGGNTDYISRAKAYIVQNANRNLMVKDVAEYMNLNPEYLTRIFKKATGINLKDYMMQCKMSAAKDLLETSTLTVSMVAMELGCSNFSHFAQMFKKYVGVTPTEYRHALRQEGKADDRRPERESEK